MIWPVTATLGDLVDRRAGLLAARRGVSDDADDSGSEVARELDEVTTELRAALTDGTAVRRVDPAEPLAGDLGTREPVNPLPEPSHLTRRLAADRRLFVIEHPELPGRPLNVLWVALVQGVPASLDVLVDPASPLLEPASADTAAFYSIWNAEPGLDGLGRGVDLIDGAATALQDELPGLATFVTLSPVPRFRSWLGPRGPQRPADGDLLRLAARYLSTIGGDGRPLDPVARFHLGNGARLWRVNADADTSDLGRRRSWGVMANYRYAPEDRAANRAELAAGRVPVSPSVAGLAGATA